MAKLLHFKLLVLAVVLATGAILTACSNPTNSTGTPVTPEAAQGNAPAASYTSASYQSLPIPLTINIDITDEGFQPSSIDIPRGERIMLVIRNRGTTEHHYHISDLVPADMVWLKKAGDTDAEHSGHDHGDQVSADDMEADEDSEHDHGVEMVTYHVCSPESGVCPTGTAVHAHADAGDKDVIIFTATNTGTFQVEDPLHPEIVGEVTVY